MPVLGTRVITCTLVSGALAVVGGCESRKIVGPTGWSVLTISGNTALSDPGDSSQLTAILSASDGSRRDVTREATWSGPAGLVTVNNGLMTATGYGRTTVSATAEGVRGSVPVTVLPAGMFLLDGYIFSPDGSPAQAQVEVSSPSRTVSGTTNQWGYFTLPGAGKASVRVKVAGYQDEVRQVTIERDTSLSIALLREGETPSTIRGSYTLTFTASPSCALPPEAMRRTYEANVEEGRLMRREEDLIVMLPSVDYVGWGTEAGFIGAREGNTVRFVITNDESQSAYVLVEKIEGGRSLSYAGTASGAVADKAIVTTFSGTVTLGGGLGTILGACTATDHSLVLTR
jgi:hypothetical protein